MVDVLLCVAGEALEAEAPSAGVGEHGCGGCGGILGYVGFQGYETLLDEGFDHVAVMLGGDLGGGVEDGGVAVCADDFQGGGFGFFVADQFHFYIDEAVEVGHDFGAAAHCGVGGGVQFSLSHIEEALVERFDGGPQSFGNAFVGPGDGGGVFTAEGAPFAGFFGGGVGDAVAIEAGQAVALAGVSVFFQTFAGYFCHVVILPVWLPLGRPADAPGIDVCTNACAMLSNYCTMSLGSWQIFCVGGVIAGRFWVRKASSSCVRAMW